MYSEKMHTASIHLPDFLSSHFQIKLYINQQYPLSIRRFHKTELDGNPALYIDAYSGSDTLFTEIISYHDGKLSAPLYEQSKQSHILTKRYKDIPCGSIDKDSLPEIPTMTPMPHSGQPENTLYLTEWKQYSKGKLETKEYSVISAGLQYKVVIDPSWLGYFTWEAVLKNGGTVDFDKMSENLFEWSKRSI